MAPGSSADFTGYLKQLTVRSVGEKEWESTRCAMSEENLFRKVWEVVLCLALFYTGIFFPYRLCFVEFKVPMCAPENEVWTLVEQCTVDAIFQLDLVLNFFFTFRSRGREVFELRRIFWHYLRGWFLINLVSSLPAPGGCAEDGYRVSAMEGLRFGSRVPRFLRLFRLLRLARFLSVSASALQTCTSSREMSARLSQLKDLRAVRIINQTLKLFWVIHLVACGWYLCATLHEDPQATWLGRRVLKGDGTLTTDLLYDQGSLLQWLHSWYFVLTVFTTVGFGDMYAVTIGEIMYASFAMCIGTVVNGLVAGEVMNEVLRDNRKVRELQKERDLLVGFAHHAQLGADDTLSLHRFVAGLERGMTQDYDREEVRRLLTGSGLSRGLMGQLPEKLFQGRLVHNGFVLCAASGCLHLPPRFPLLLALAANMRYYQPGELVYHCYDHPWNLFLVLDGTFAYVGQPGPTRGLSELTSVSVNAIQWLTRTGRASITPDAAARRGRSLFGEARHGGHPVKEADVAKGASDAVNSTCLSPPVRKGPTDPTQSICLTALQVPPELWPYQLFSSRSYFGEAEVLTGTAMGRLTCARCESEDGGTLLVLAKDDLLRLGADFPHFEVRWRLEALRRGTARRSALDRLTQALSYRVLAAHTIQDFIRHRQRQHGSNHRGNGFREPRSARSPGSPKDPKVAASLAAKAKGKPATQESVDKLHDKMRHVQKTIEDLIHGLALAGVSFDQIGMTTAV